MGNDPKTQYLYAFEAAVVSLVGGYEQVQRFPVGLWRPFLAWDGSGFKIGSGKILWGRCRAIPFSFDTQDRVGALIDGSVLQVRAIPPRTWSSGNFSEGEYFGCLSRLGSL